MIPEPTARRSCELSQRRRPRGDGAVYLRIWRHQRCGCNTALPLRPLHIRAEFKQAVSGWLSPRPCSSLLTN